MANLEEEIQVMKEKNNELVQKVQHWKMLAAQRENEKLDLMKELNEMRLKLARLRSNGNIQASRFDSALQSASEKALAYLVKASGEITRSIDLAKTYMRERKETEALSPRWSSIGGTPKIDKVHRVPPMMIGGQSIQPVVSLSRNDVYLNINNTRSTTRSPNRNVTERALPMHMLQDVYIPLTRIDAELVQNMETEEANNSEDSAEELGLENSDERNELEESQRVSDDYNASRRLDAVAEDLEPEDAEETLQRSSRVDNPLEGPSWLLDGPNNSSGREVPPKSGSGGSLEPDSTTEVEEVAATPPVDTSGVIDPPESVSRAMGRGTAAPAVHEFSPTVRRRKRASSPPPATPRREHFSPRPHHRRNSNTGRVLKVMVAKMRLESLSPCSPASPPSPAAKRRAAAGLMDAPSPNGATVPGVIVSEATQDPQASGEPNVSRRSRRPSQDHWRARLREDDHRVVVHRSEDDRPERASRERRERRSCREARDSRMDDSEEEAKVKQERESRDNRSRAQESSRMGSSESRDSDSGSEAAAGPARSRRARNKVLSYQEKPLNRKLRR